jgi:catechol 2,3-dioxygenase-like lactoylglutathione lyase family enzyme
MDARVISSDGPVISTSDFSRQRALFEGVLGLVPTAEATLDATTTAALFGVPGRTARVQRLVTPGTSIGVMLVRFEPLEQTVIRPGGVGIQTDALKVVDFFTTDLDRAVARLTSFGFDLVGPPALLELPTGETFHEAHVRAPDGVIVAFIHPLKARIADYVTITDRLFSEVQSCSGPVSDLEPAQAFYEDVLGLACGLRYEFESESFGRMVGTGRATRVRARNFGRVVEDVMLGLIHYGLPPGFAPSLRAVCRAPNRGLIGVQLTVQGLDVLVDRCRSAGFEVVVAPAELTLPWGRTRTALVLGPHGVAHLLREVPTG